MDLEAKIASIRGTLEPMAIHTIPYLSSVIGVESSGEGRHLGSACWCVLDGGRCLVTAAHVIDEALKFPSLAATVGDGLKPRLLCGEVLFDRRADVAVWRPPDDLSLGEGKAWWPEDRLDASGDFLSTDFLFVHGFPGASSYPSALLSGVFNRALPYGAMRRTEDLPPDLAPFHFALNFDPRNIQNGSGQPLDSLPDPRGLSGCPVFRIGISGQRARDWQPSLSRLVGFVTEWMQDFGLLIATSVARVQSLVKLETPAYERIVIELK